MSEINFHRQHYQPWEKNLSEENILDRTSKYFTLDGNKKDQNHCDVTFIWGEITLMSGQTLMKRTKYFFLFHLMLSEANFLCARENGSFVEVFPLLKHIKNLYLSSFLTQRVTFQVFQTSSLQHFHKTDYYWLENGEGQSWFGKWLELPWYWCVRVELSLQQGEKHG